jgi:hypothetical protein
MHTAQKLLFDTEILIILGPLFIIPPRFSAKEGSFFPEERREPEEITRKEGQRRGPEG